MKIIHFYGIALMLLIVGVVLWTLRSALVGLAWLIIDCSIAFALVGLLRFAWPIIETTIKARLELGQAEHEQWKSEMDMQLRERMIAIAERSGNGARFENNGTIEIIPSVSGLPTLPNDELQEEQESGIPASVRYEDVQAYIPRDHVLIGVGEGGMVDTREKEIKGLIWIPGSSGAGKSNTTALRVEEDYERDHRLLGIDPHFFKEDSLSNLVRPYLDAFIEPIAYAQEDILRMLNFFIDEAERRKAGGARWPLTLLYDEIGSQVSDKPEDDLEKEIIAKTKKVIRLAGQETRGFNMNVIAISQDAAGLAFLRKRALLVLGHKTVMMSERELVCNGRTDIARQMDEWPVGRTVVYGVAVQGILVRQQPLLCVPRVSSASLPSVHTDALKRSWEANGEAMGSEKEPEEDTKPFEIRKFLNEAGKMRSQGMSIDAILKSFELPPGGRNNQNLKALLEQEEF